MKSFIITALVSLIFSNLQAQESVSASQLSAMLNGGYTNVQTMNQKEAKKASSTHTPTLENAPTQSQNSFTHVKKRVPSTSIEKVHLGECTLSIEGRTAIINGGEKIYQCSKGNWVTVK